MPSRCLTTLLFAAALAIALLAAAGPATATTRCDLVAAPNGSDAASGVAEDPLQSAQGLVDRLQEGQVGCFRAGDYSFAELQLSTPGITLTSYPGDRATLHGRLWIAAGADDDVVSHLDLDGRSGNPDLPSPTVNADGAVFDDVDVTNYHTGICFVLGNSVFGRANGTVIEDSRIHDCGRLPSENQDHGIYLSAATGTLIRNDWIYDNADRGIQLYPDAQGTRIVGNVIDGNGEGIIFSGDESVAASDTVVERNIIANSRIRRNVESSYAVGAPVGVDNVVRDNCLHGAASDYYAGPNGSGVVESSPVGFEVTGNVSASPEFVDADGGDFRLRPGSPCAGILAGAVAATASKRLSRTRVGRVAVSSRIELR